MARFNLNKFAKLLTKKETGKKEVSIAQMKEIIKLVAIEMVMDEDVKFGLERYGFRKLKEMNK